MNHLAVGVQSAMYTNFLAFELPYFVLVVDVVSGAAGGILESKLVTRLHDRTGEDLDSVLLRLSLRIRGRLSRLVRRLPWLLLRLLSGFLSGTLGWILLWRRRCLLCMELNTQKYHPGYQNQHGKRP